MYKLTVVSGPNRGTGYVIQEGETSIGRQTGNVIVLPSARVSKSHCRLVVNNDDVIVEDQGSSNGTFVNGAKIRSRSIKPGDRISVGDFVLELTKPAQRVSAPVALNVGLRGNVLQFPSRAPMHGQISGPQGGSGTTGINSAAAVPTDLVGRLKWGFENKLMPVFYGFLFKHEWRMIGLAMFSAFMISNLVISVSPLMEENRQALIKETRRRARFMAKQIVERNLPALRERAETKTDVNLAEDQEGVKVAVLIDLDNRILAPGNRFGQIFASGSEAAYAIRARNLFREGEEKGMSGEVDDTTVAAVEPVKFLNPQTGRNEIRYMAIVSLDTTLSTPGMGDTGVAYSETLILTALLGGLILLIMYKLTLKPLELLNDDIDKVLKGELNQVTHEFKFEELNTLWDNINSALQRVPKSGGVDGGFGGSVGGGGGIGVDDFLGPLRTLGNAAKFGMLVCDADRKIVFLNSAFEEISGIRSDGAVGQDVPSVARDQAFGSMTNDLFDRSPAGGDGPSEDFDFSGISYKLYTGAFGSPGTSARGFLLVAMRQE